MTDDKLPIVFTPSVGSKLGMFLVSGFFAAAAVWKIFDDRPAPCGSSRSARLTRTWPHGRSP